MSSTFVTRKRAIQYTAIAEVADRVNYGSNRLCPVMVAMQNAKGALKTVLFELKTASWRVFIRQVGKMSGKSVQLRPVIDGEQRSIQTVRKKTGKRLFLTFNFIPPV